MTAAMIPGLIIAAAGTGAQYIATRRQAEEQKNVLNKAMAADAPLAQKQSDLSIKRGELFDPATTLSDMAKAGISEKEKINSLLSSATGAMPFTATPSGRVSPTFATEKAKQDATTLADRDRLTTLFAKMLAPGQVGVNRGITDLDLASQQGTIMSSRNANQAAAQSAVGTIGQNPWLQFGGGLAAGAGQGMASNAAASQANQDFWTRMMAGRSGYGTSPNVGAG